MLYQSNNHSSEVRDAVVDQEARKYFTDNFRKVVFLIAKSGAQIPDFINMGGGHGRGVYQENAEMEGRRL